MDAEQEQLRHLDNVMKSDRSSQVSSAKMQLDCRADTYISQILRDACGEVLSCVDRNRHSLRQEQRVGRDMSTAVV